MEKPLRPRRVTARQPLGTRGLLLALLMLAAAPLCAAQSVGLSSASESQRIRAEAAHMLAAAQLELKLLEDDARSVAAELDLLRAENARRYFFSGGVKDWPRTCHALTTVFLAAYAHHLVALAGYVLRKALPAALRSQPWCREAASAASSASALLSRLTRRALSLMAGAFLRCTGVTAKRRRTAPPAAEPDGEHWGSWADSILDGGGGSPTARGDPGLAQRKANAAAAVKQAQVEARERRFAAYAAKAAEFSAGQAAAAAEEVEEVGGAEAELQRLIRLADGEGGGGGRFGFGRRRGGGTGRAFWLRVLRLPAQGGAAALVARQHRRLSALVHPDKMQHARAVDAQALLNAARDGLLDAGEVGS